MNNYNNIQEPQFKDVLIKKPQSYRLPTLELNGKWLSDLGFCIGDKVYANFQDGLLTLSTQETSQYNLGVLVVKAKRVRGRVRPQLFLNHLILHQAGYDVDDRIGMTLYEGCIQMIKIPSYRIPEAA